MAKVTIERIREIVAERSGGKAKLLSDSYKGQYENLLVQCQCGNTFERTYASIRRSKLLCPECVKKQTTFTPTSFEQVKEEIAAAGCEYISGEYINFKSKLTLRCSCGRIFIKKWAKFKEGQNHCPQCGIAQRRKYNNDSANSILSEHGYTMIGEYKNQEDSIKCLDSDNNVCYISMSSFRPTKSPEEDIKKRMTVLENQNCKLKKKNKSLQSTVKDLKSELKKLRSNTKKLDSTISDLKRNLSQFSNEIDGIMVEIKDLNSTVCSSISEVKDLSNAIQPPKENDFTKPKKRNPQRHSELGEVVRDRLEKWKNQVRKKYNGTCPITGQTGDDVVVHHLLSLNIIFEAVIPDFDLDCNLSSVVDINNNDEYEKLIDAIVQMHDIDMGIVISKEIHNQFHKEYKYGDNTPEQFNDFLMQHYNITLKELQNTFAA